MATYSPGSNAPAGATTTTTGSNGSTGGGGGHSNITSGSISMIPIGSGVGYNTSGSVLTSSNVTFNGLWHTAPVTQHHTNLHIASIHCFSVTSIFLKLWNDDFAKYISGYTIKTKSKKLHLEILNDYEAISWKLIEKFEHGIPDLQIVINDPYMSSTATKKYKINFKNLTLIKHKISGNSAETGIAKHFIKLSYEDWSLDENSN